MCVWQRAGHLKSCVCGNKKQTIGTVMKKQGTGRHDLDEKNRKGRGRCWFGTEREAMKGMTAREKAAYIWEYDWYWIVGAAALAAFLIFFIYRMFFAVKENWLYVTFANTTVETGKGSDLWEDFEAYAGYDLSRANLMLNDGVYFDPTTTAGTMNSYYEAFVATEEAGTLDAVTMPKKQLQALGSSGRLLDLRSGKAEGLADLYADRLVACVPRDPDSGSRPVVVGIDVSDSLLVTKYHLYGEDCVLGVGAKAEHINAVKTFLDFIFGKERRNG